METITLAIAGVLAAAIIGALILVQQRVAVVSEKLAAPARAKTPEERTLTDKLAIEADKRIDALNIQQFEGFLTDFIDAHLDDVLRQVPVLGPLSTAAGMVENALDAFQRRNPDLAAQLKPSVTTMTEKLAGAIGRKDVLAEALKQAVNTSAQR